ncbi:MAG TPA: DUF1707 domain-containing protein [Pseudonocardiaceae bacterium]|nr:DUF1707 domain-containing protein [Pseudonocardiaceae bacterium]
MSEQPVERPKHLDLRASDADRERVANVLHQAVGEGRLTIAELDERLQGVYAAKTLGDLVPFTADLPVSGEAAMPVQDTLPSSRIGGTPTGSASIAVLSGFNREGEWVVPRNYSALAFMGGGSLDMSQARFAERETTIQVFAFMGGIEIIVPDDITVRVNGFGFMGGFDHKGAHDGPPGAPVLTINGFAFMGGVDVRPPKRKELRRIERDQQRRLEN